eukprot:TRINITY_DN971_c0_g1_i1.p1 TRINITY_DN971_c0_g1~~TRINITY_DN971_c0_g1_i1.p1  ORF type:complete len:476 (-),score=32.41 TRINITY_DN971_c0_g1_i1:16-1443(-)
MENSTEKHKEIESFLKWASSKGAIFPKIEIRCYGKDFRGVHAASDISKGERIVTIPYALILTESTAYKQSPLAVKIKASDVSIGNPYCTYIECLLFEAAKDINHPFRPYFDVFPTDASTFPFFYSGDDLAELQELSIAGAVADELKAWNDEYERIVKAVPEFAEISAKRYIETGILLCSRNFACHNAPEPCIVAPLADMFNHYIEKRDQTTWRYVPDEKSFVVIAKKDIKQGEVISLNYGAKPSSQFLHYYGFVPEYNEYESVPIPLALNKTDPLLEVKQNLIGNKLETLRLQCFPEASQFCYSNYKLMSYLRFIEYKGYPQQLSEYVRYPAKVKKFVNVNVPGISRDNECFALRELQRIALERLNKFSSSHDKDVELIKKEDTPINKRNLAKVRSIERRLYERIVEQSEKGLTMLQQEYDNVVDKEVKTNTWFSKYVEEVILSLALKKQYVYYHKFKGMRFIVNVLLPFEQVLH